LRGPAEKPISVKPHQEFIDSLGSPFRLGAEGDYPTGIRERVAKAPQKDVWLMCALLQCIVNSKSDNFVQLKNCRNHPEESETEKNSGSHQRLKAQTKESGCCEL
jgi:hypothetical protein